MTDTANTWLIVLVNQSIIQTGNNSKVWQCIFIEGVGPKRPETPPFKPMTMLLYRQEPD